MLPASGVQVYLALGATDMRKAIDGLSILVSQQLRKRQNNRFFRHMIFLAWSLFHEEGRPWQNQEDRDVPGRQLSGPAILRLGNVAA